MVNWAEDKYDDWLRFYNLFKILGEWQYDEKEPDSSTETIIITLNFHSVWNFGFRQNKL